MAKKSADRLFKFGLPPDAIHAERLLAAKGTVIYLGGPGAKQSFHAPRLLQCKSVNDAKTWIGVPDAVLEKYPKAAQQREAPKLPPTSVIWMVKGALAGMEREKDFQAKKKLVEGLRRELSPYTDSLSAMTRSYIYGNAKRLAEWEQVLSFVLTDWCIPFWAFNQIIVEAGSVLELGPGTNILSADELIIEHDGTVRAYGALALNVGTLKRPD